MLSERRVGCKCPVAELREGSSEVNSAGGNSRGISGSAVFAGFTSDELFMFGS